MKCSRIFWAGFSALAILPVALNATDISGALRGVLTQEDSPYYVLGHLTVNLGDSLIIRPGVRIEFVNDFDFTVNGTLFALGTAEDSVVITSNRNQPNAWDGIHFIGNQAANSRIEYCVIADAYRGIQLENTRVTVTHCRLSNHEHAAIRMSGSQPEITDCLISDVPGNGIAVVDASRPTIRRNVIENCGGIGIGANENSILTAADNELRDIEGNGIDLNEAGACEITGNVVMRCDERGIYVWQGGRMTIRRNVVFDSGMQGIYLFRAAGADLVNNTILNGQNDGIFIHLTPATVTNNISAYNNQDGIFAYEGSDPLIRYNDVLGNGRNDYSAGAEHDDSNISLDPWLTNPDLGDFTPRQGSPVIDAGAPSIYDPDGTRSDIGAWFFNQNVPPEITEWEPQDLDSLRGGGEMHFSVTAVDANEHPLSYAWYLNDREVSDTTYFDYDFQVDGDYTVRAVVDDGYYMGTAELEWNFTVVGAAVRDDPGALPQQFALSPARPNPFNSSARMTLYMPSGGWVQVDLFDGQGRRVGEVYNSYAAPGGRELALDGSRLAPGWYVLRARAGGVETSQSILLSK